MGGVFIWIFGEEFVFLLHQLSGDKKALTGVHEAEWQLKSQWNTPTTVMHAHRVKGVAEGLKWGTSHLTVGSLGLLPPLLPLTLLQQWPRCLRYGRGPPSLC